MAKSGGAWKVAYADFVTAMMAFFLVMWICGQDNKIKQAIARYFNNPLGVKPVGESKVPDSAGNIFTAREAGEVPHSRSIALGMGRRSYSTELQESPGTKVVADYLIGEGDSAEFWQEQAAKELKAIAQEGSQPQAKIDSVAAERLSKKLKARVFDEMPAEIPDLYRDLLFQALQEVNWVEIAEDLVDY